MKHGTTAYRNGCRCETCKTAQKNYNASYHAAHQSKINAAALARRNADPERARRKFREWHHDNIEYSRMRMRDQYWTDPVANRERKKEWARKNPAKKRAQSLRYHDRSKNANGRATSAQIAARIAFFGGRCSYCGGPHEELEHAIPLSRGGTNWPANLRTSCIRCNALKGTRTAGEFIAWRREHGQSERGLAADGVVGPATFAPVSWEA